MCIYIYIYIYIYEDFQSNQDNSNTGWGPFAATWSTQLESQSRSGRAQGWFQGISNNEGGAVFS